MKYVPTMIQDIRVAAPRYVLTRPPERARRRRADILVIGGGAAGLAAALRAAEQAEVTLLTRAPLPESNSAWAQGGIAAALDPADSPALHIEDTLVAGAGLSDRRSAAALAWEAPELMHDLAAIGVPFERDAAEFALGLEGGHSHRRILHTGDSTGWAITSALIARARACPHIRILEGYQAVDLLGGAGSCGGALALDRAGEWHYFQAAATILATGGAGALYGLTSNQPSALGEGIALAYRAGAEVSDMEFVQFHPTVFRTRSGYGFLISEAVRGEGGLLFTPSGDRFMPQYDPRAELAPRDVVSRAIFLAMRREVTDHVLLDLTHLPSAYLERRFPTILARCRAEGIDPTVDRIPVAPAAHYLMGGIRTDMHGATNLAGLYAAGECACTGVHGANRLASNSLLECLIFGRRAGAAALEQIAESRLETRDWRLELDAIDAPQSPISHLQSPSWRVELAAVMRDRAGLQRSAGDLRAALAFLSTFPNQLSIATSDTITAANAALVARLIVTSALLREESRGAHARSDFPHSDNAWLVHLVLGAGQPPQVVESVTEVAALAA